eukprot:jgi/Tetstr1/428334/TSEL_018369.t1
MDFRWSCIRHGEEATCEASPLTKLARAPRVLGDALRLWADSRELTGGRGSSPEAPCTLASRPNVADSGAPPPSEKPGLSACGDGAVRSDWGSASEWLPQVSGWLDGEAETTAAARLVCRDWASSGVRSARRLTLRYVDAESSAVLRGGMEGLVGRCRELRELGLYLPGDPKDEAALGRLLAKVRRLPHLNSLHLACDKLLPSHIDALMPVLPRLKAVSLVAARDAKTLMGVLHSLRSVTDLQLDIVDTSSHPMSFFEMFFIPQRLTRLRLVGARVGALMCLRDLSCLPTLTELSMDQCTFNDAMGLSSATNLTSLVLQHTSDPKEQDLQDILGLTRLQRLRINEYDDTDPGYVKLLAQRLTSLVSLALPMWTPLGAEALLPLSALAGLTDLQVGVSRGDLFVPPAPDMAGTQHLSSLTGLKRLKLGFLANNGAMLERILPRLDPLTQLHTLSMWNVYVTADAAALLPTQLQHLGLDSCFQRDEDMTYRGRLDLFANVHNALVAVGDGCPGLTSIDLPRNDGLSLSAMTALLARCTQLARIYEGSNDLTFSCYDDLPWIMDALLKMRPNPSDPEHEDPWYKRNHVEGSRWAAISDVMQQRLR